jgi:ATP-dependent Lhr-like helicase
MCGAAPFAELERADFDQVVELVSEGIVTGRGRRAAYLHRDRINGVLRARRGARLAALTSGGAIPEIADYRVLADPDDTFIGSVFEDFAIESMPGDIFLLGSTSWRIRRIESGVVRVVDAGGAPPTIPFWQGEAPARSAELSEEVSVLRESVEEQIGLAGLAGARSWVAESCRVDGVVADQVVAYLGASLTALGRLPTSRCLVFERFFDEAGGMQLVVHSPLGARVNRALCLALRKKFCRSFNFELQAAANDDALVLSLGPHHSFPLDSVPRFLSSASVEDTLEQATLASPMFSARWRWNLNRSLAVLRFKGGKRNPPPIQRMEADDLLAAVFPNVAACQENVSYPIEIPDHPLVRQTIYDCLHEAMDVDGLGALVRGFEQREIETHFVDASEPSPLGHEILNSRPYTFLDDAPLEERRTRAVVLRRGLPVDARELGRLDPEAIAKVREEVRPDPRDAEELHDLLLSLLVMRPVEALQAWLDELVDEGRAVLLEDRGRSLWCASERRCGVEQIFPEARVTRGAETLPDALRVLPVPDREEGIRDLVRGQLDLAGPVTTARLAEVLGLSEPTIEIALAALEAEGFVLRGTFEAEDRAPTVDAAGEANPTTVASLDGAAADVAAERAGSVASEQYCSRRLLTRIHRYTRDRLRSEIEPVSARDFIRFLLRWQHVAKGTRSEGRAGVATAVEQLQGFELAAGAWEESVLPARVEQYRPAWLDSLCLSGELSWGRLSRRTEAAASAAPAGGDTSRGAAPGEGVSRGGAVPSRATPLAFALRADLRWLLQAHRGTSEPAEPGPGPARDILACLRQEGALFHSDLVARSGRLPVEVEEGLWGLVGRGLVTADGFQAIRSLLGARERWARTRARERARRGLRRGLRAGAGGAAEGRWSLFPSAESVDDADELAEAVAEQLLVRWGVVFRDLMARENLAVPWRDVVWALRRLEARGVIRGGRFVSGFVGEQFGLPEAVDSLRRVRRVERSGEVVRLSAADPLNLVGVLTPGPRVPAVRTGVVIYCDGLPVTEVELRQSRLTGETAGAGSVTP